MSAAPSASTFIDVDWLQVGHASRDQLPAPQGAHPSTTVLQRSVWRQLKQSQLSDTCIHMPSGIQPYHYCCGTIRIGRRDARIAAPKLELEMVR